MFLSKLTVPIKMEDEIFVEDQFNSEICSEDANIHRTFFFLDIKKIGECHAGKWLFPYNVPSSRLPMLSSQYRTACFPIKVDETLHYRRMNAQASPRNLILSLLEYLDRDSCEADRAGKSLLLENMIFDYQSDNIYRFKKDLISSENFRSLLIWSPGVDRDSFTMTSLRSLFVYSNIPNTIFEDNYDKDYFRAEDIIVFFKT